MHLKSTSAIPMRIVLAVTPVPSVFEIGAFGLVPVAPFGVGATVLVPLPHAASRSATASTPARTAPRERRDPDLRRFTPGLYAPSVLVRRTGVGGAPGDLAALELRTVARARHVEVAGHVAGVRTAPPPEHPQRRSYRSVQLAALGGIDADGRADRVDPGAPEHLVDKQVAEPRDARLVHEHRLHGCGPRVERVIELAHRERERVGSEARLVGVE